MEAWLRSLIKPLCMTSILMLILLYNISDSVLADRCLLDIQTRMDGWVHIRKIPGFTRQKEISTDIEHCLAEIDDCLTRFHVRRLYCISSCNLPTKFSISSAHRWS